MLCYCAKPNTDNRFGHRLLRLLINSQLTGSSVTLELPHLLWAVCVLISGEMDGTVFHCRPIDCLTFCNSLVLQEFLGTGPSELNDLCTNAHFHTGIKEAYFIHVYIHIILRPSLYCDVAKINHEHTLIPPSAHYYIFRFNMHVVKC